MSRPPFPLERTIPELQRAMEVGHLTSLELVDFYLARIAAYDQVGPALNAFILVNPGARDEAAALDAERAASGPRGPLHGIPVAVKDNIATADMPTTAGSIALKDFRSSRDAFVARRLREAGAVIIGKTNLYELAAGWQCVSSLGGQTRSPYDLRRDPGGSSGGTAVAVSANLASVGLGTDTCGSVRYPAAHNNLFGLRPSIGLTSRDGVVPLAPSLDIVGPLARSVVDLAILFDVIARPDSHDPTTVAAPVSLRAAVDPHGLSGRRVGVVTGEVDPDIGRVTAVALQAMASAGVELVDVTMPDGAAGFAFFDAFAPAIDAYLGSSPGAPVTSLREIADLHVAVPALQAELVEATAAAKPESDAYRAAVQGRAAFASAVASLMDEHRLDAIAYPSARSSARPLGEAERQKPFDCISAAYGGFPAMSLPIGFDSDGLPVGLELMARRLDERTLIAIASGFEARTSHRRLPRSTPPYHARP